VTGVLAISDYLLTGCVRRSEFDAGGLNTGGKPHFGHVTENGLVAVARQEKMNRHPPFVGVAAGLPN
jgi:hypothetical protein